MNEHLTVALDSDGVVCDFEGLVCKHLKIDHVGQVKSRGQLWWAVDDYNRNVAPFFESLPKMPDADRLVVFVRTNFVNHFILTACGYTPKDGAGQKKRWFAREYGHDLHVKVVTGSGDKAAFATPTTILIDDRAKSIDPWVAAGGIGILHKRVDTTIARLLEIIEEHRQLAT